jgi:hypothetical protein
MYMGFHIPGVARAAAVIREEAAGFHQIRFVVSTGGALFNVIGPFDLSGPGVGVSDNLWLRLDRTGASFWSLYYFAPAAGTVVPPIETDWIQIGSTTQQAILTPIPTHWFLAAGNQGTFPQVNAAFAHWNVIGGGETE